MSTVEAPRKTNEQIKAELSAFLEEAQQEQAARHIDLPDVLGEYRAVVGHPGWYMRRMKLRQEQRAMQILAQRQDETENVGAANLEAMVMAASLLLYRLDAPQDGEDLGTWARGATDGSRFRAASLDDILDEFDSDNLNESVMVPMGLGIPSVEEQAEAGNG